MTVLIAIPAFGVPGDMLDEAVTHALAQTADCVVLVTGDGVTPPVTVRHDRLVVGTFPVNRGAPFTQQAMILGSPFAWYAPMGADDFIDSDHIATLLATRAPAAGSRYIYFHHGKKVEILRSSRTWIEFGCFRTDLLRSVGGYNASEPCGQDSVLTSILLNTAKLRLSGKATYHKRFRANSLTHHPDTKQGSPIRMAVKVRNNAVLTECIRLDWDVPAIRAYRDSLIPASIKAEIDDRAGEVARWLS